MTMRFIEGDGSPVVLESATSERLLVPVETDVSPVSSGSPEFQITTGARSTPDGTWVAGAWASAGWSSRTERVDALTPLVGDGAALDISEGTVYDVWLRFSSGVDTPVLLVGQIEAR